MADRVRVPRLTRPSRTMWFTVGLTGVAVLGLLVWGLASPVAPNRVGSVVLALVLVLVLGILLGRRTWLDIPHGRVVRDVWGLGPRSVAWADAEAGLRHNRGGTLLLEVRGSGQRASAWLPLVAVDLGGDRSQDPALLRELADQMDRWSPRHDQLVADLRAQSDHLAEGGSLRDSPLVRRHLGLGA